MSETYMPVPPAQVLTIAGSDSGGGAGIQADLKTFQMRGVFGTSVLTAVTAQNTTGVSGVHLLPGDIIRRQIEAVRVDFQISAFKIGMLGTAEIIECVAEGLAACDFGTMVLDPVMVAKGGTSLLEDSAVAALRQHLLPRADLLTPNLPEVAALTGIEVNGLKDAAAAAKKLQDMGVKTVLIKGGHLHDSRSEECLDWLFLPDCVVEFAGKRHPTKHTHGTGCTFSACITAELAKGVEMEEAVRIAKRYISEAVRHPLNIGAGHGPVNHWAGNR